MTAVECGLGHGLQQWRVAISTRETTTISENNALSVRENEEVGIMYNQKMLCPDSVLRKS